jgi:hypothetical protein
MLYLLVAASSALLIDRSCWDAASRHCLVASSQMSVFAETQHFICSRISALCFQLLAAVGLLVILAAAVVYTILRLASSCDYCAMSPLF